MFTIEKAYFPKKVGTAVKIAAGEEKASLVLCNRNLA